MEQVIREAAAKSLAALCQENLKLIPSIMEHLLDTYQEKLMVWLNFCFCQKFWSCQYSVCLLMTLPLYIFKLSPKILGKASHSPYFTVKRTATGALSMLLQMIPGVKDDFGREISPPMDCWEPRWGVAHALHGLAPLLDPDSIVQLMSFLLQDGLRDRHPDVRHVMLEVALGTVNAHGKVFLLHCSPQMLAHY